MRFYFRWYDFWVGWYWGRGYDGNSGELYIGFFPMFGVCITPSWFTWAWKRWRTQRCHVCCRRPNPWKDPAGFWSSGRSEFICNGCSLRETH